MKVTTRNSNGETLTGILTSNLDGVVHFIPKNDMYGHDRITIEEARIAFSNDPEDDDGMLISGYKKVGQLHSKVCLIFHQIKD